MLLLFQVANQIGLKFNSIYFDSALTSVIISLLFREKNCHWLLRKLIPFPGAPVLCPLGTWYLARC